MCSRTYITMWTLQSQIVIDTIERDGVSYVKKEYLRQKYEDSSWIFETAYDFLINKARSIIPKPREAESMVWMFRDKKWAMAGGGGNLIKLEVPRDEIILFDLRKWQKILSLSLIGDPEAELSFENELRKMGLQTGSDVFEKPFYPIQKQKILKSWSLLFSDKEIPEEYIQGATWCIKKEWIVR